MTLNKGETRHFTIYGDNVVKYGEKFIWDVEIIKGVNLNLFIGIIPNIKEVLIESQSDRKWYERGGYFWWTATGWFVCKFGLDEYCDIKIFENEGDKLQIRFDWKENALNYIANGKDFGNALILYGNKITIDANTEFRLEVCFGSRDFEANEVAIQIDSVAY